MAPGLSLLQGACALGAMLDPQQMLASLDDLTMAELRTELEVRAVPVLGNKRDLRLKKKLVESCFGQKLTLSSSVDQARPGPRHVPTIDRRAMGDQTWTRRLGADLLPAGHGSTGLPERRLRES